MRWIEEERGELDVCDTEESSATSGSVTVSAGGVLDGR